MSASIFVAGVGEDGILRGSFDVSKKARLDMFITIQRLVANAGGSHPTKHPWSLLQGVYPTCFTQGVYATCETRWLRAPESDQTSQSLIAQIFPRMASKPERPRA